MNLLRNVKISHKLGFLILVALLGFAAVGGMYREMLQLQSQAEKQTVKAQAVVFGVEAFDNEIATGRRQAEAFFLQPKAARIEQFQVAMRQAEEQLGTFAQLALDQEEQETLTQLQPATEALVIAFEKASATRAKLGFGHDSGIQQTMRSAVHNVEENLSTFDTSTSAATLAPADETGKIDNLELSNLMLTLRRNEKDYIQREDDTYVNRFADTWDAFKGKLDESTLSVAEQEAMIVLIDEYFAQFLALVEVTAKYNDEVVAFQDQEVGLAVRLNSIVDTAQSNLDTARTELSGEIRTLNQSFLVILVGVALVVIIAVTLIGGGLFRSVRRLQGAVTRVAAGDLEARATMTTQDELGQLGNAFDSMLDERLSALAAQAEENDKLNESVVSLMEAADRLSKRDLTVKVPVTEDATGNIADALNMMTAETARVMGEINGLAVQLEESATAVQEQGGKVLQVAATEREVVGQALQALAQSSETMTEMAELAATSNELADNTSNSTKRALGAVRNTVQSMNEIRTTVSETEKSIKRLGERSQEIGAIVEIIKDIADRTHTLALNAGMQAVAAGEAGRGFSVVADEVQRLAETARESTGQIVGLVSSIQAESSETMATMNKAIGQVVEGSELAERSGKRMRVTQKATQDLVSAVQQIAERSKSLVAINETLRGQASQLQESTQATEQQLEEQGKQTQGMFKYLQDLVASVRVFKLPDDAM